MCNLNRLRSPGGKYKGKYKDLLHNTETERRRGPILKLSMRFLQDSRSGDKKIFEVKGIRQ